MTNFSQPPAHIVPHLAALHSAMILGCPFLPVGGLGGEWSKKYIDTPRIKYQDGFPNFSSAV